MSKFSFRRKSDQQYSYISHGLVPAASIAPKPAVPRTPPPRSPDPSPERPRSALAAAVWSSSLTGRTFAVPPARPRSLSDSGHPQSVTYHPDTSTALYAQDTWPEYVISPPRLPSPGHSDEELDDREQEEEEEEEERRSSRWEEDIEREPLSEEEEGHIYQSLDRRGICPITEPVYTMPLKNQGTSQSEGGEETDDSAFLCSPTPLQEEIQETELLNKKTSTPKLKQKSSSANRSIPSPDVTEETSGRGSSRKKKCSVKRREGSRGQHGEPGPSQAYREVLEVQKELVRSLMEQNAGLAAEHRQLEQKVSQQGAEISRSLERQRQLEEELKHSKDRRSSAGLQTDRQPTDRLQTELRTVRQQAQELVDENDGLKLTVHRLNVELSRYQAKYRPLSPQEGSRVSGLPVKGSPPPWLLDVKYLCPLLLAYEDRINEKDSLLKDAEEEMRKLRVRVDEVVTENLKLHEQLTNTGVVSHNDWHELKEQAALVLQENQVLIEQLELQHVKTKDTHNKHHNEVCKVSKRMMLLEEEKRRLEVEFEESRRELSSLQAKHRHASASLENAVSWEEHCHIAGKLKRQLEQEDRRRQGEVEELLHRMSALQEEKRSLVVEKTNLTADLRNVTTELELLRQTDRRAQRKIGEMERQVEECKEKELTADQYLAYVVTVAERSCHERDQLICMASKLEQDKKGVLGRILEGTVRLVKLQEKVKLYRRQATSSVGALDQRLRQQEEDFTGRAASYQREIEHLHTLLGDGQDSLQLLLQQKRSVEEELEVVWQAATRENQTIKETLLECGPNRMLLCAAFPSPSQPSWAPEEEEEA